MGQDPNEALRSILEAGRNVRLGRGLVAKTGHAAVLNLAVWGVIAWRWTDSLVVDAGLLLIGGAATAFTVWWTNSTQRFAERNPAQAMLEGAEFLEYRRMEVQAKGLPPVPNQPLIESAVDDSGDEQNGR